jgi:hypothetical protein
LTPAHPHPHSHPKQTSATDAIAAALARLTHNAATTNHQRLAAGPQPQWRRGLLRVVTAALTAASSSLGGKRVLEGVLCGSGAPVSHVEIVLKGGRASVVRAWIWPW